MNLVHWVSLLFVLCVVQPPLNAQRCIFTDTSLDSIFSGSSVPTGRDFIPVPVVFNVLYEHESENISDNQILSQLEVLNADYAAENPDLQALPAPWRSLAGPTGIRFCLYNGPDSEGGIRRRKAEPWKYGPAFSIFHEATGGIDGIDPQKVLNIWITQLEKPLLGYANPVHQYLPSESGVVADYRCVGSLGVAFWNQPFHLGRTLTHEIGHYFGLLHVWGNFEEECAEDDGINDTPAQYEALYHCPEQVNGCADEANVANFMNLVDDACMAMFTKGQGARMQAYIAEFLPNLGQYSSCADGQTWYLPVSEEEFWVFPNPNQGNFVVQHTLGETGTLNLYDAAGRLVYSSEINTPNMQISLHQRLANGLYFLALSTTSKTVVTKMIIRL
jgi:hypothetical protein